MRVIRFGPNGWRARLDDGFDDTSIIRIADALGRLWSARRPGARVFVGYDTRHDADRLAVLAGEVLASFGLEAKVSLDACPMPALAMAAARDDACIGAVMLTASEDPCEYGGVLLRGHDGGPVSSAFLANLERTISAKPTAGRGAVGRQDFVTPYIECALQSVDVDLIARAGLSVVVDPMHGAASPMARRLFERLGCKVSLIHDEGLEDFGGLHPEPVEPWVDDCECLVREVGATCGVVLDGDADRAAVIDERGRLVSRHDMVPMLIGHLVENRKMSGRVVATTPASTRVMRQAERLGCSFMVVPVGFERIYAEATEGDVLIGTEEYGGICVPSHLMERDGLFASLLLLELAATEGKAISELVDDLDRTIGPMHHGRKDIRLEPVSLQALSNLLPGMNPESLAGMRPVNVSHADGLRLEFEDGSWVLMRISRTTSLVRIYAESPAPRGRDALLSAASSLARSPL